MLENIHQNYPDAAKAVFKHEAFERHRLGIDYDSTYKLKEALCASPTIVPEGDVFAEDTLI